MKKIYLLLGLGLLLLYSCQKDEIITEDDKENSDYFSFEQKPFNSIPDNLQNYFFKKTQLKAKETPRSFGRFGYVNEEVPVRISRINDNEISYTFALIKVDSIKSNKYYVDNLVITEYIDKGFKVTIIRYLPQNRRNFHGKINSYSGQIQFFQENGEKLGQLNMENGEEIFNKGSNQKGFSTTCTYTFKNELCTGEGDTMKCVAIYEESCTTSYTDEYLYLSPDDGGGGSTTTASGPTSDPTMSGPGSVTTSPIPEEEDKIFYSQLKDCHSKIIDTLKTVNTGIMGKMIQKLAGSNPTDYNWIIDYNMPSGSNPDATASTNPVATDFTSTTHINLSRVQNSTDLSMARTFVHEAVHAFLAYQYRNDQNASELNYTEALNTYASQYNTNANDTHHVLYLKENLITPIANALQEMGAKLGYQLPPSFYLDLAYGGLYNSSTTNNIFNYLVPNQADRDRIKSRISAETDNTTVNGISPAGKKAC